MPSGEALLVFALPHLLPANTLVLATFSMCYRILSSFLEFVIMVGGGSRLEQGWRRRQDQQG